MPVENSSAKANKATCVRKDPSVESADDSSGSSIQTPHRSIDTAPVVSQGKERRKNDVKLTPSKKMGAGCHREISKNRQASLSVSRKKREIDTPHCNPNAQGRSEKARKAEAIPTNEHSYTRRTATAGNQKYSKRSFQKSEAIDESISPSLWSRSGLPVTGKYGPIKPRAYAKDTDPSVHKRYVKLLRRGNLDQAIAVQSTKRFNQIRYDADPMWCANAWNVEDFRREIMEPLELVVARRGSSSHSVGGGIADDGKTLIPFDVDSYFESDRFLADSPAAKNWRGLRERNSDFTGRVY